MSQPRIRFFCLLVFSLVFAFEPCRVHAEKQSGRPKIGLVLGGGGARGAAHVGILKVIEELQIPVDYVVGTSMGAIVGAAYAAGLSPAEIGETLTSIDWNDLFVDDAPRQELSFRDKLDQRRFTGVEVGIRGGGLALPRGAFAGRKLEFLLQSVFLHVALNENFDQLALPFRAVATNIETGDATVLSKGNLALAVRASMSIPGAFSPVEIDGSLLVDGYVSNNVPIDVAKAMGAEVIIAVDVGTPLAKRDKINSLLDIVNQVGGIATIKNVQEQVCLLTSRDLLLRPELGDLATTDFKSIEEIIPLGEVSARQSLGELKKFSVSVPEYQVFLNRQRKHEIDPVKVDFVKIAPLERVAPERIEARLDLKPGEELVLSEVSDNLTRIQSLGEFEQVGFTLVKEGEETGILVNAKEKSWGPSYLRFGFNLSSDFDSDHFFNVLIDHRLTSMNALGGELESQLQIGRTTKLASKFYQPLDYHDRFFIEPKLEVRQDLRDIYDEGDRLAEYRTRKYGGGGDLGVNFSNIAELRAGLWRGYLDADPSTGAASLPNFEINRGAAQAQFTFDQVDNANFPRHGGYFRVGHWLERSGLGGESSYDKTEIVGSYAASHGPHTLLPRILLGLNPDDDLPFYDEFLLGGGSTLSGYRTDELHGRQMGLAKLMYYYQLSDNLFSFTRGAYLGGSLDWGNVWRDYDDMGFDDLIFGGSIYYGTDTILGPVYLGYGINEDAQDGALFFSIGQRL